MRRADVQRPRSFPRLLAALLLSTLAALPADAARKTVLEGVVRDLEGVPQEGIRVALTETDGSRVLEETVTDSEGKFRLRVSVEEVERFDLHLSGPGFEPHQGSVELEPKGRTAVEVDLLREGEASRNAAVEEHNAGVQATQHGDMEAALEHFRVAVEHDPGLAASWKALAHLHYEAGELAEAAEAVERYLELEPGDMDVQRLAVAVYTGLGEEEKAAAALEPLEGTELVSKVAVDFYNAGARATREGETEAARAYFQQAMALDPDLALAHTGLAVTEMDLGNHAAALEAAERAIQLDPEDLRAHLTRIRAYGALQDREGMEMALAEYGQVAPEGAADILYQQAEMDYDAGLVEEAREAALEVLEMDPDHARAHYTLGRCYLTVEENEKAREHLERFLELAPDDPDAPVARELLDYL